MAEALISVLLEQLASIIRQQVQLEVNLVGNVKKEVEKLIGSFGAIEAVLKDAEARQVEETGVRLWLDRLKDVSYEVEDVLDEWNTEILRVQIEKEGGNAPVATTTMVSKCIPAPFFCSGQVSRVIFPHDIPGKIQELNERLALIVTERQNYNFQYTKSGGIEQIERQETISSVGESFGRVDETKLLVSMLLSESSQDAGTTPVVISIVGMGGIGKTTLAQLAYKDERVKANFTKRIWVCVSYPFDEINIAKAIIRGLDGNVNSISNDLETFSQCIRKCIARQKFLLVLDDVWNEDDRKWEKLRIPLQNGAIGSKIIVTTRKEEVATVMGAPDKIITLKVLSDENCWLLFRQKALANIKPADYKVFEPIGKKIVKKCKGLPLVANTLGGLMRFKKTKKEWENVLSDKIWASELVKQVFQPLLLSYYDLDPMIKRCLLYCVIFPKDHNIRNDILIELWMSQGYISSNANKENTMMDIGELYFDHLVTRSFFQDFEKDYFRDITFCKMHDIVHDFLQFLTKDEYFIVEAKGGEEKIARHLTMTFAPDGPFPISFDNCKSLRTFTTFDCKITSFGNPELILQLKCMRTLNLSDNQLKEVPKEVGGLVHLRYLDLSRNHRLEKLPDDTLCKLVNLQTLKVEQCDSLEELPEEMGKLTNLRHLHVWECWKLKLPKTIGRLTSLETLDWVNIWGHDDVIDNNKQVFKLSDLRNMDHLKGTLRIEWRNKESEDAASDADKAKLVNKKHLLRLVLWFWWSEGRSMIQEEIVSALQPNPNLESLFIVIYSGTTLCPHWMKNMNNLTSLTFWGCGVCEFVPLSVLGNLGSLQTLTFHAMGKVKKVEFEGMRSSPHQGLSLISPPRDLGPPRFLAFFLNLISHLKSVKNLGSPFRNGRPRSLGEKYSLLTTSESEFENLTSSSSLEQVLFPSLKYLQFEQMPEWEERSDLDQESDCVAMPCLEFLAIQYCPKLKALPHFLRKTQLLQELTIEDCGILSESCKNRRGKEWPNISHIPNIRIEGKIVQKDGVWIQQE